MKKNLRVFPVLFMIFVGIFLSGCGDGEIPEEAKAALDKSIGYLSTGAPEYAIVEAMKAPRKENGTNSMQSADEVWCVLINAEKPKSHYWVLWREGLLWTARYFPKSVFLAMECTNVED